MTDVDFAGLRSTPALKRAPGKDIVVYGGASFVSSLPK